MNALVAEWVQKAEGDFTVDVRYPGEFSTKEEAHDAVKAAKRVQGFTRDRLRGTA